MGFLNSAGRTKSSDTKVSLWENAPPRMHSFVPLESCMSFTHTLHLPPRAARARLLHPQPRSWYRPHGGALGAAAALQRGPAVGDVRGAHVHVAQQEGAAAQEVHQDRSTVRSLRLRDPKSASNTLRFLSAVMYLFKNVRLCP